MAKLTFTIEYRVGGTLKSRFTVPARESGRVGIWYDAKPYQPNDDECRKLLPHATRKAFTRSTFWWQHDYPEGCNQPLTRDLFSTRGKPMGKLTAKADWTES